MSKFTEDAAPQVPDTARSGALSSLGADSPDSNRIEPAPNVKSPVLSPAVAAPEAGWNVTAGTPSPTEVHPMKIETWLDHQTKTTEAHISDNGGNLKEAEEAPGAKNG